MKRLFRGLNRFAGPRSALIVALVFFLSGAASAGASRGQRKRPPRKPATNTRTRIESPVTQTREQEVQLERLPPDPSVENADIAITAHVKARSLIFEAVPNPTVEFSGQPQRDTVWEAQRENLPTPVQPGVTYRNIGIRLKITSVFSDIDRIVAEALGEIPVSDDKTIGALPAKSPTNAPTAKSSSPQPDSSRPGLRDH
jgi:hypothetical protein